MQRKQTIRIIGMRELRQNLSKLLEEAQKKNVHFVVTRHGKIVAHIYPPTEKELWLEKFWQIPFDSHGEDCADFQRRVRS